MNLIEQLGGYEHLNGFYKRAVAHGFTLTEIKEELLKYRRQHNIFESDDLVTSKKWVDGSIHKIELVDSEDRTLKIFSHDMAFSYWVDSRNYRHAPMQKSKRVKDWR